MGKHYVYFVTCRCKRLGPDGKPYEHSESRRADTLREAKFRKACWERSPTTWSDVIDGQFARIDGEVLEATAEIERR